MADDRNPADPRVRLLHNARREARLVLSIWAVFLVWVVGFSYLRGYQHPPDSLLVRLHLAGPRSAENFTMIGGLPDWVFWGIGLPWLLATALTLVCGLKILRDDDLGAEPEEEPPAPPHTGARAGPPE